ncbi:2-nitropropane dioxygenase [candidate division KSB1 bacterium 4484_188]|nr:MAG: 2-nitropropane dioxygenase [candidate division KSB1 bacterium 4484_188]HFE62958.1 nitronate monooxygenase [Caldithrix sp.]
MGFEIMPKLNIGDLEVPKPIIQGGMGVGISMSGLASAVANEGGIGVISSVGLNMLEPVKGMKYKDANVELLKKEIRKARVLTNGIIGVNIMVALTDYHDLLKCTLEEEVDAVFLGAGLPLRFPEGFSPVDFKTKFLPIVSSGRAARLIFKSWEKSFGKVPDGIVVEGPLAGGHLGFKKEQIDDPDFALEKIIPEVLAVAGQYEQHSGKEIPIIAAGGIFTGADILKFLRLGASGVQMATRFVATHECDASDDFKQAYIQCREDDIEIIQSPVGLPGRAIRNTFLEDMAAGEKKPVKCPWKCLKTCDFRNTPYCIAQALTNAQKGKLNGGFAFAGANAFRVDKIVSVKELFEALQKEYIGAAATESIEEYSFQPVRIELPA